MSKENLQKMFMLLRSEVLVLLRGQADGHAHVSAALRARHGGHGHGRHGHGRHGRHGRGCATARIRLFQRKPLSKSR